MVLGKSPEQLLPGFTEKVKYMNERTIKSDNTVEKSPHMSPRCLSTTNTGGIPEEENKDNSIKTFDKVDEPSPKYLSMTNTSGFLEEENKDNSIKTLDKVDEPSPKCISTTNTGGTLEEEKKNNSVEKLDKVDDPSPPEVFRKEVDGLPKQQQSDVDPSIESSSTSFSDMGNFGFMYYNMFNNHSSTDVGKNDSQTKLNL